MVLGKPGQKFATSNVGGMQPGVGVAPQTFMAGGRQLHTLFVTCTRGSVTVQACCKIVAPAGIRDTPNPEICTVSCGPNGLQVCGATQELTGVEPELVNASPIGSL